MKVRLGDVATYINGYPFKPSDWSNDGVPIIRIQDLTGNAYKTNKYNGVYDDKYEINNGGKLQVQIEHRYNQETLSIA